MRFLDIVSLEKSQFGQGINRESQIYYLINKAFGEEGASWGNSMLQQRSGATRKRNFDAANGCILTIIVIL